MKKWWCIAAPFPKDSPLYRKWWCWLWAEHGRKGSKCICKKPIISLQCHWMSFNHGPPCRLRTWSVSYILCSTSSEECPEYALRGCQIEQVVFELQTFLYGSVTDVSLGINYYGNYPFSFTFIIMSSVHKEGPVVPFSEKKSIKSYHSYFSNILQLILFYIVQ